MRWYALLSVVSNGKIIFLLGFVIFAILIAVILTIVEFKMKHKQKKTIETSSKTIKIRKIREIIELKKSAQEKLNELNLAAKEFFHENFHINQYQN